ncbi:arabinofuranosidase [Actinoplanes sp. SE50]|uniref:AbfB domain-containing protein n=1 Tax=unclassified Actinoplanes TaxID=2626549 RepID=UPI00023EC672|nr:MULTISPECIES: AbfB domain-containing protein [unclassified Actinoplanes]AEV85892.1 arabinofuranosidase [Actinoplanes sp. SE50/110]ATO84288.1 arabinofuranosidase [Actinoplanes sp. SE50]SLM01698.1 arabinofuranosidase [Actinoplanes sp. SE50/110]
MTIYGPGGVDVRDPRRRLHPGVLALVITAVIIIVAALAYFMMRSPADPTAQPAAVPSRAAAIAPSPASSPSPTDPSGLTTGSWQVTAADDRDTYLTVAGDFAAMSEVAATITVVEGLADDSCFTFRDEDGNFLRHYNYRLRFDPKDDSDLFRGDATFCAEDDQPGNSFRVRSKNYPDYFLHRRGTKLYIDKPSESDDFVADSTFALHTPTTS